MAFLSIGDLAQSFQLRRDSARLAGDLQRLTGELSSGKVSDVRTTLSGDLGPLAALERSMATLASYRSATQEAALFAEATNSALETVRTSASALLPALFLSTTEPQPSQIAAIGTDAARRFDAAAAALNVQVVGRSIFAGEATDRPALIAPDALLSALAADVAPETTAVGVASAVDAWFGPGGGFETTAYAGSATPLTPSRVADGEEVGFAMTALDPALREALAGLAMAALLDRNVLAGSDAERAALATMASDRLIASQDRLVVAQSRVGAAEAVIEDVLARTEAELSATERARADLVGADPYETATRLRSVESQLEALFTVTARLSRLTLTDFLR